MTDRDRAVAWRQDAEHPVTGNSSQERAIAWLDAHPEVVEARVAANSILIANSHAMCVRAGIGNPLGQTVRMLADDLEKETRAALVAFLTSPLPCANPKCQGGVIVEHSGYLGLEPASRQACPDCMDGTDGTAGILLDQLEARYEEGP